MMYRDQKMILTHLINEFRHLSPELGDKAGACARLIAAFTRAQDHPIRGILRELDRGGKEKMDITFCK